jgi:Fuc2NAc and GlcNAc transferase
MIPAMIILGTVLSWLLTALMRRYALSTELLDHPNQRSSHSVPTPRGGGIAIVVSFVALAGALAWVHAVPPGLLIALLGSGGIVALVGFFDDRHPLRARWRFLAHALAAVWTLWVMGGIPPVPVFGVSLDLGWFGLALAAVYVVWMINLCNFMDGIDGIASVEAISASLGGALCWWLASGTPHWPLPVVFAACVAGFLIWNYPPAKIFMGDAGSGFVGMVLGLFSLWTAQHEPQVFWCWFILFGCFMVDATTTLVRRVRRGESFSEAHRSHAYQYASRKYASHQKITLAFGAINLLWLLPIALLVATRRLDGAAGAIVAYAPLVWLAFRHKAGDRRAQDC